MKRRTIILILALWTAAALFSSCDQPAAPETEPAPSTTSEVPDGYPPVPKPSDPLDLDQPLESERYEIVVPIQGKDVDFAPTWSAGMFTWDTDVQNQLETCLPVCEWYGEDPGDYWNGTRHSSQMIFENGGVNLTHPSPTYRGDDVIARQLLFVQRGQIVPRPRNPGSNAGGFYYMPPNSSGGSYPSRTINPCLFLGYVIKKVDPPFLHKDAQYRYYVAATACPALTNPVFVKRERFWRRILIDGKKSIRVDPGNSFEVSYTRTEGTSSTESQSIAHTLNGSLGGSAKGGAITGSLGYSLTETFETSVELSEETSVTVTRTVTGIDGKTVIYSVWGSVERYSIVDETGNPYTDPNFTFSDLGDTEIKGEYEWLSSTIFDFE